MKRNDSRLAFIGEHPAPKGRHVGDLGPQFSKVAKHQHPPTPHQCTDPNRRQREWVPYPSLHETCSSDGRFQSGRARKQDEWTRSGVLHCGLHQFVAQPLSSVMRIHDNRGQFIREEVLSQFRVGRRAAAFVAEDGGVLHPADLLLKPVGWTQVLFLTKALEQPTRISLGVHGLTLLCRTWLYRPPPARAALTSSGVSGLPSVSTSTTVAWTRASASRFSWARFARVRMGIAMRMLPSNSGA